VFKACRDEFLPDRLRSDVLGLQLLGLPLKQILGSIEEIVCTQTKVEERLALLVTGGRIEQKGWWWNRNYLQLPTDLHTRA
jgi:hypothetical protein